MRTVALVDDDRIIREDIRRMIDWEANGYRLVLEAANGKEALSFLMKNPVDIMITDISMPVMNGIEMIKSLKSQKIATQVLVLSNYDDFDYVKDAMKYGAYDYLLKYKVTPETLLPMLHDISEQLEKQSQREQSALQTQKQIEDAAFHKLLKESCRESFEERQALNPSKDQRASNRFFVFFLLRFPVQINAEPLEGQWDSGALYEIELSDYECVAFWKMEEISVSSRNRRLQACAERLLQRNGGIVVYDTNMVPLAKVSQLLKSLRRQAQEYYYTEQNIMTLSQSYCFSSELEGSWLEEKKDSLISMLRRGEKEAFENQLNDVSHALQENHIPRQEAIHHMEDIIYRIRDCLLGLIPKTNVDQELKALIALSSHPLVTLQETQQEIIKAVSIFLKNWDSQSQSMRPEVEKAVRYIYKNFAKSISLNELADYVGLSRNHFCTLFKQETGENFISYLSRVRIEESKSLLKQSGCHIQEASFSVGIDNPRYFCKLFKRYMGMTPKEYKGETTR